MCYDFGVSRGLQHIASAEPVFSVSFFPYNPRLKWGSTAKRAGLWGERFCHINRENAEQEGTCSGPQREKLGVCMSSAGKAASAIFPRSSAVMFIWLSVAPLQRGRDPCRRDLVNWSW